MGQINFTVGLVMVALFIVAIMTFAVNFASENDASMTIADDGATYAQTTGVNSTIEAFNTETGAALTTFRESNLEGGVDNTEAPGSLRTGDDWLGTTKDGLQTSFYSIFGGDNSGFGIILTAIIAMITLITALYWWKTIKGGQPD